MIKLCTILLGGILVFSIAVMMFLPQNDHSVINLIGNNESKILSQHYYTYSESYTTSSTSNNNIIVSAGGILMISSSIILASSIILVIFPLWIFPSINTLQLEEPISEKPIINKIIIKRRYNKR